MPREPKTKILSDINIGFDTDIIEVTIEEIISLKSIDPQIKESHKFKQILASIKEVGIIEPPVLAPMRHGTSISQTMNSIISDIYLETLLQLSQSLQYEIWRS